MYNFILLILEYLASSAISRTLCTGIEFVCQMFCSRLPDTDRRYYEHLLKDPYSVFFISNGRIFPSYTSSVIRSLADGLLQHLRNSNASSKHGPL